MGVYCQIIIFGVIQFLYPDLSLQNRWDKDMLVTVDITYDIILTLEKVN